ncbi:hypothetical protein [Halorussus halobius]|uniref:hypothetical protein n=1 Tax=Halorussus halobius TaxID=1710537 RepID=UPI001091C731|nr:hypothetical protein [Halorussus halobius]
MADDAPDPAELARRHVRDAHAETVEAVLDCADSVADSWDGPATSDPGEVAGPLRAELDVRDAWARLPDVLAGAVRAAGFSLPASPVAAPPYVAATSRGPVLRATVPEGRLVLVVRAFAVERDPTRYVRGPWSAREAVCATFK